MTPAVSKAPNRAFLVAALGLSQIIGYGTLYYSFSVLAPAMAHDLRWPTEWVFGALSAALLVGGLTAPKLGRSMDKYGPGRMMTLGSVASAISLVACAVAPEPLTFVTGLVILEVASTLVQYNAAFALLVHIDSREAQKNITYLTLIAGFASTIFWPLTSAMQSVMTWREVYFAFAAVHLLLCLPIHLSLSKLSSRESVDSANSERQPALDGSLRAEERPRAFLLMAAGFALTSFVSSAILIHMLPLMTAIGLGAIGVLIGTLFGPAQVLSRLLNMIFGRDLPPLTLAIFAAALSSLAMVILLATAPSIVGAFAFSIVFGLGSGLGSIVQGTAPLALFGRDGYGLILGRIAAVRLIVSSAAPFVFAFVMANVGPAWALALSTILSCAAVFAFWLIARMQRKRV